jgi:hypothetical protein
VRVFVYIFFHSPAHIENLRFIFKEDYLLIERFRKITKKSNFFHVLLSMRIIIKVLVSCRKNSEKIIEIKKMILREKIYAFFSMDHVQYCDSDWNLLNSPIQKFGHFSAFFSLFLIVSPQTQFWPKFEVFLKLPYKISSSYIFFLLNFS